MRKVLIGLLAVVPIAMLAFAATSASAFEWLCGGQAILTSGNCKVLSVNLTTFLLNDRGVPAEVECPPESVTDEGSITGATTGTTTAVAFTVGSTGCKKSAKALNLKEEEKTNGCEELESITTVNLPWTGTISEEESGLWWILVVSGTKAPGYATKCKAAGLKGITDTCEAESAHAPLVLGENLSETETIEGVAGILLFDIFFVNPPLEGEPEFANCSIGGTHQGIVEGEQLLWGQIGGKAASLEIS